MACIQVKQDWEAVKTDPVEFARNLVKGRAAFLSGIILQGDRDHSPA
jgi:hypothetical protein